MDREVAREKLLSIAAKADGGSHMAMGIYRLDQDAPHILFPKRDVGRLLDVLRATVEEAEELLGGINSSTHW